MNCKTCSINFRLKTFDVKKRYKIYASCGIILNRIRNRWVAEDMIREFRMEDSEVVYSIMTRSLDQYYDPSVLNYFHSRWASGQLVACDILGTPIGALMSTKVNNRRARIMMLAVEPTYRGRGVGHKLLNTFRFKALMEGIIGITLEVRFENSNARRFYIKNGFVETAILVEYYRDKGKGIRMYSPIQLNM